MSRYRSFKATERQIAKRLGGERHGHLGGADVVADWLSVECKHRKMLHKWLKDALEQAKGNADGDQLALVVLHEHGARHDDDIVLLSLRDFEKWQLI